MFKYFSISFIGSVADPVLLMMPVLVLTTLLEVATDDEGTDDALPFAAFPFPLFFDDVAPFPFPLPIL